MPISAPNIVYFDNIPANHPSYVQVNANYLNKKIYCQATNVSKNVKIYQKKWVLQTSDKQKEMESFAENIDFSLARKYPIVSCETILFDGLLYKQEAKLFTEFVNWQNISPAIKTYTLANISEFSISDFYVKQAQEESYFCESLTGTDYEQNFCSLIDSETGQIEKKNIDYINLLNMLGGEKYRIFNILVGIKNQNKILLKNNVKFIFDLENKIESTKSLPNIHFVENKSNYYLLCKSDNFLFSPNAEKFSWYINGKKIENKYAITLPMNNIKFGQSYSCETNNGISEKFVLDKKFLKIIGNNQIGIPDKLNTVIEKYNTNIDMSKNNVKWSCIGNENIDCLVSGSDNEGNIELKLKKNENFKNVSTENFVSLKLQIDDEIVEKKIIVYAENYFAENIKDISKNLSIALTENNFSYLCKIPEKIASAANYQVFWFLDESEISKYRNSLLFNEKLFKGNLSCTVVGKNLNQPFIGTVVLKKGDLNEKNPSWLKDSYLFNLASKNIIKLFRDKKNSKKNDLYCYIHDNNSYILTENVCKKDKYGWYFINISDLDLLKLKKYISENDVIDVYNIANLPLYIRKFENSKVVDLKSSFRMIVPNYKPNILYSGLINKADVQKCYVFVQDPQNLFLATKFSLENNKISRLISSFDQKKEVKNSNLFLKSKIFPNGINLYEFYFDMKLKEENCNIAISNGTQVSYVKARVVPETKFLAELKESENKIFSVAKEFNVGNSNTNKKTNLQLNLDAYENIKVKSFLPFNDLNLKDKLKLKYLFYPKSSVLNVFYSTDLFLYNIAQKNFFNEIEIENIIKKDKFDNLFIAARMYQDNKNSKRFFCENSSINNYTLNNSLKYTIYLNSKPLQSKISDTYGAFFELENYQEKDTVACQIDFENIIERSSFNQLDNSELSSYCFAMDSSKSIVRFDCPKNLNFSKNSKEIKNIMKEFIIKNFDNYKSLDYINISVWSLAEKNKYSISMNLKKLIEE